MADEDFDDGGTPMWRARNPYRPRPQPRVINLAPRRGVVGWFRKASPLEAYIGTVALLGAAVFCLIVAMAVLLIIWDAVAGHRG